MSGRYYLSLMYNRLRTSDTLHKKTGSPGYGWTLGPNCAFKILTKLERNDLYPLATDPRHECDTACCQLATKPPRGPVPMP
jgi:hypothetical protein